MKIDRTNIRLILQNLEETPIVEIVSNINVQSICACSVMIEILRKRLVKYEVNFKEQETSVNFTILASDEMYTLLNETDGACLCNCHEISGMCMMYEAAKSLGIVSVATVWPMAVTHSFFRLFREYNLDFIERRSLFENNFSERKKKNIDRKMIDETTTIDGSIYKANVITIDKPIYKANANTNEIKDIRRTNGNIKNTNRDINAKNNTRPIDKKANGVSCQYCVGLRDDIFLQIKRLDCSFNGIFHRESLVIPFLNATSLCTAIKTHVPFVLEKKTFIREADAVVYNTLARIGISISQASEKYAELPELFKHSLREQFGTEIAFVLRNGHDIELTSLEHALLICHFIESRETLHGLLSLTTRRLMRCHDACEFYTMLVALFVSALSHCKKAGHCLVFSLTGTQKCNTTHTLELVCHLIERYVQLRFSAHQKYVVITNIEEKLLVVGRRIDMRRISAKIPQTEFIRDTLIKLNKKYIKQFIKSIAIEGYG